MQTHKTKVCIVGSGPAAHTAAIYAARAELNPLLFEGSAAPGGQLTATTDVENYPGFPEGILGVDIVQNFRKQSERFGTKIFTETVNRVDFSSKPFKLFTDSRTVLADAVIISTGAVAKRLSFIGSGKFWNRGISACAVCDGAAPMFRNKPLVVIGGGDSAMEEAIFLTKYGSMVYIIHRRDKFRASQIMLERVLSNPKIEVVLNGEVVEAYGDENGEGVLGGLKVKNVVNGAVSAVRVSGLFFAIGHEPATKFLGGQVELDEDGYVVTKPGTTKTSVAGVFAAGGVQDKKYRQAITAAGTGCMAALDAEHYLQEIGSQELRVIREDVGERPIIIEYGQVIRADPLTEIREESKRERCKWNPTDDEVLITAWLNTSKDPDVGHGQRPAAFWKRISAYFSSSAAAASLPKRERTHCKQRWHKINDGVSKFVGCYDHALSQRTLGQSEDDVLQLAYHNYFNDHKCKFTLEHAWRRLRHDPKWRSIYMSQSSKTSGSSKRAKLNEGGTVSSNSNTESNVEELAASLPVDVRSSKLKEKMVVTETTNEERESEPRSRLEKLWALNEKDIVERSKLSRIELLRSLLEKPGKLSEKEEALKDKLIDEML